ncbi:hypothetical protein ANCDUO_16089, partial [Ancylostoma duodenale]
GFAVVALMAGVAIDKIMATRGEGTVEFLRTSTDNPFDVITDRRDISPIQVATMLTFSIGIWEKVCDLAARVHNVNFTAFIVSAAAMSFLYVGREFLSPFLVRKFKFNLPIPYELILLLPKIEISSAIEIDS